MTEVQYMREIENLEALVKSLEQSNERLKQSVVDLLQERVDDAVLMHKAADEIERLRAAIEVTSNDCKEAFADNERLREVLSGVLWMAEEWFEHGGDETTLADDFEKQIEAARAALEGK